MEDSNFNADYAYYCEADIDSSNIENIYQLNEELKNKKYEQVKDYNFGDLVSFSEYRNTNTFIIGKDGNFVRNPDYGGSGYLTIPYEITQYFNDSFSKYSEIDDIDFIELRYDDKFILEKINTKSCKIPKDWKLTWSCDDMLQVEFPNGKSKDFEITSTSANKIKKWYQEIEVV